MRHVSAANFFDVLCGVRLNDYTLEAQGSLLSPWIPHVGYFKATLCLPRLSLFLKSGSFIIITIYHQNKERLLLKHDHLQFYSPMNLN